MLSVTWGNIRLGFNGLTTIVSCIVNDQSIMARDVSSSIFPQFNASYILAFQFSSWFPAFSSMSIRSTIIRPLDQEFKNYLESDGVFVPEGSEDALNFFSGTLITSLTYLSIVQLRAHFWTRTKARALTVRSSRLNIFRFRSWTQEYELLLMNIKQSSQN